MAKKIPYPIVNIFSFKDVLFVSNGFHLSRFDLLRYLQTLVQMLASFVVVIIINGTLSQYS